MYLDLLVKQFREALQQYLCSVEGVVLRELALQVEQSVLWPVVSQLQYFALEAGHVVVPLARYAVSEDALHFGYVPGRSDERMHWDWGWGWAAAGDEGGTVAPDLHIAWENLIESDQYLIGFS